ncbi:MAG: hypothetical protein MI919_07810, partial [Holophagales bacterium]|nr:hypothetical protein [Holophagales bacterium]
GNIFRGTGNEGNCFPDLGIADKHNLSGDASCGFTGATDLELTDPRLFPLAWAGGPTPSHVPAPDSPLLDAALEAFCIEVDQRGVARPVDGDGVDGAECDIGAVEYLPGVDDPLHVDGFETGNLAGWSSSTG